MLTSNINNMIGVYEKDIATYLCHLACHWGREILRQGLAKTHPRREFTKTGISQHNGRCKNCGGILLLGG